MKKFERCTLPNGFTLLLQSLPALSSASIGVVVKTGSRYEGADEVGLSHLLEHMVFQGTPKRDTRELSRVLSAVGGNLDAYTSRESTAFYAKVPAHHLSLAMDVLADMLAHSRFAPRNLEKEKHVIFEEIRMYEDEPEELVHDVFAETLWPRHSLGRPIIGTRKQVGSHTPNRLRRFWNAHYRPERMLISVAGNIDHAAVKKMAARYFGKWPTTPPDAGPESQPVPPVQTVSKVMTRQQEQTHVCLGTQSFAYADPRRLALLGLSNVLGGGTNSRLFYEVRERRALAYSVYSFLDFYHDAGVAGVYAACQPRKTRETIDVIQHEIQRLVRHPITDQEMKDLREQMKGNLLLSLENSSTHMWRMIQQEMYLGHHPLLSATLRAIERLTRDDIHEIAHDVFAKRPLTITAVGPISSRQVPGAK